MREFLSSYRFWLGMPLLITVVVGASVLLTVGKIELIWAVILGAGLAAFHHYMAISHLVGLVATSRAVDIISNIPSFFSYLGSSRLSTASKALRLSLTLIVFAAVSKVSREALYALALAFVGGYSTILLAIIRYELRRL